jgi:L-erythro-3,5-diaminohexanoate dehydrogenase
MTDAVRTARDELGMVGIGRVLSPRGVMPQAADVLDTDPALRPGEARLRVERLNLDAASLRQLRDAHGDDPDAIRSEVLEIIGRRGKMHNPVTGSGGMCIGTVEALDPASPLDVAVGDRVATMVSLTLTPLVITDGLRSWDGLSEQVPCAGYAILFGRTAVARIPDDLTPELFLSAIDVCGAPALTARTVAGRAADGPVSVGVFGGAGKSGSLSLAAARGAGADRLVAVVRDEAEVAALGPTGLADELVVADARDAVAVVDAVARVGGPFDVVVVCVDVPGCEHAAILACRPGGTVIFFSMATSFSAAALGAEGFVADVTMVIGNGYTPGHADLTLELLRTQAALRRYFEQERRPAAASVQVASAPAAPDHDGGPVLEATHRRYLPDSLVHYGGGLAAGAFSMECFGDVATELMIRNDQCEGLFAAYEDVQFLQAVRAGDVIEASATLRASGERSRALSFVLRVVARRSGPSGEARLLPEPIVATTARGVVVVPRAGEIGEEEAS